MIPYAIAVFVLFCISVVSILPREANALLEYLAISWKQLVKMFT